MFFQINKKIVDIVQFEKKEPHYLPLPTKNPQTGEKKRFIVIEGTLF